MSDVEAIAKTIKANWNYPTHIVAGAGRISELPDICSKRGIAAPLLVTDPGIARLPMFTDVLKVLTESGLQIASFTEVKPNPTGKNVEAGIAAYRDGAHDGVIAIGGGSALDAGKSIALLARQECSLWDLEDIGDNFLRADASAIAPVIAVPTTAGTGSEVGRAALIVNEHERRKVIIFHPQMMPVCVVLDPELSVGLPAHLTAATGMDALSHNLEAYCSPMFHPMAEGIAIQGMALIKQHLPTAVVSGSNLEARLQMLVASMMGATAFQRGLGAMHALAHPLGAVYDAHHGLLNAVLMPYVLKANRSAIESRIAHLARCLELEPNFDAFLDWVLSMRAELAIPHSLSDFITKDSLWADIGRMAAQDPSAGTNPIPMDASVYQRIVDDAFSGAL